MADPTPTAEDYRKADVLTAGFREAHPTSFRRPLAAGEPDPLREFFALGIAIARTGGDVAEFVRRWASAGGRP